MGKLKHHSPLPVLFCVACLKCLVVQDGFLLWKSKQVYPAHSIPIEESVLLQGHPKTRPVLQAVPRHHSSPAQASLPPGLYIPLSLPQGTLELSVLLLIFAAPKLEFCLLLSSHLPIIPENPNTSPGFSQTPHQHSSFPPATSQGPRPCLSTNPHSQLTPACSSIGKRALSSFSADDRGTGSSLGFCLGEATQGIFQSQAGNKWKSESLDFCHSVASVQIILSKC